VAERRGERLQPASHQFKSARRVQFIWAWVKG
jgi:hypothetical protein